MFVYFIFVCSYVLKYVNMLIKNKRAPYIFFYYTSYLRIGAWEKF